MVWKIKDGKETKRNNSTENSLHTHPPTSTYPRTQTPTLYKQQKPNETKRNEKI